MLSAVTGALIAAGLGEHRQYFAREIDERIVRRSVDMDGHNRILAAGLDGDGRFSVTHRLDDAAFHAGDVP